MICKKRLASCVIVLFILCMHGCSTESQDKVFAKNQVQSEVHASGVLESKDIVSINPPMVKNQWQYKITYMIDEGSQVQQGQKILSFDTSSLQQELMVKQSELNKAQKQLENQQLSDDARRQTLNLLLAQHKMNLEKAKRKWEQSKELVGKTEVRKLQLDADLKQVEYELAKFQLEHFDTQANSSQGLANAEVNRLQTELNQTIQGISRLTVVAPKSGMVVYKEDYQGNKPVVGDSVWMGRTIMELPSIESLQIKASIDEVDASQIKLDLPVSIEIDALPGKKYTGRVVSLGQVFHPRSRDVPAVVFDAGIEFDDLDYSIMRPGMNARVKIQLDQTDSGLSSLAKSGETPVLEVLQ